MNCRDVAMGLMFFSQTAVGIVGNFSLLYYYLVLFCNECTFRSTDMILRHLIIANTLIIFSKGIPQTMTTLGVKYYFNDYVCKLLLYMQRVGRSVSIFITCLLSIFQNITISPMNSFWRDLKGQAPKYIGFSISICWILYMIVNSIFPFYIFSKCNNRNLTRKTNYGYCSSESCDKITDSLYAALFVFPEVVFSMLIILSSVSMIVLLHRHKQRVQHIHSIKVSSRSCPESRATQRIVVLVCSFVSFYTLSSLLNVCVTFYFNPSWWLVNTNALISMCFPTISPFIIMNCDSIFFRLCSEQYTNFKMSS